MQDNNKNLFSFEELFVIVDKDSEAKEKEVEHLKIQNDLGKDSVPALVLRLAVPAMVAQFVNVLYSIIDRMYIGNIREIGDLALAGVGVCGPIVNLLSSFGTLVGLGGSIFMAMKLGEKKEQQAKQILANSFLALTVFAAVLTVVFLLLKEKLLLWFGASAATMPYADTYLTIYTAGTFFALMAIGLNYFITCQGFATIGMASTLIGAVVNIILDPVFIFVFGLDVAGAAIATVIAQFSSFAFVLGFLRSRRVPVRLSLGGYQFSIIRRILALGFSPFLILATDNIILIVLNSVLQFHGGPKEGDLLISCATIVQSYMLLITGPMLGISGGTQALISFNYGARNSKRIKEAEKYILLLCLAFTTVMFLISRILPQYFVLLFTRDSALVELSVWGIQVFTLAVIPLSFQYVLVDGLTALGCCRVSLTLSLFRKGSFVAYTLLLPTLFAAKYTFYAEPLADIICSTVSTIVYLLIINRHLRRRELAAE